MDKRRDRFAMWLMSLSLAITVTYVIPLLIGNEDENIGFWTYVLRVCAVIVPLIVGLVLTKNDQSK